MEKLGGWKSICTVYGSKSWVSLGCREKTEEETVDRLSVLKPKASQLLGIQILLLRISGSFEYYRLK